MIQYTIEWILNQKTTGDGITELGVINNTIKNKIIHELSISTFSEKLSNKTNKPLNSNFANGWSASGKRDYMDKSLVFKDIITFYRFFKLSYGGYIIPHTDDSHRWQLMIPLDYHDKTYTGFNNCSIEIKNYNLYLMDLYQEHAVANIGKERTNLLLPITGFENLNKKEIINLLSPFINSLI